jgi:hypothetical protein
MGGSGEVYAGWMNVVSEFTGAAFGEQVRPVNRTHIT